MNPIYQLRRKRYVLLTRRKLRRKIAQLSQQGQLKLNIGSGILDYDEWLGLNLPFFDLTNAKLWAYFFKEAPINNILLEHVLEHLTPQDVEKSLSFARKYLRKDGVIRIAVPDKNHPDPEYIEYVRPGGSGAGADDHKSFWNYSDFIDLAKSLNYKYRLCEYYDEQGKLNMEVMDSENGTITRTARKEVKGIDNYSSLIIDLSLS